MAKQYLYFFTRQDISPEQQIVQTAHVALKLGHAAGTIGPIAAMKLGQVAEFDPDTTYFTVVGVRNQEGLLAVEQILREFNLRYEKFYEPDLKDEMTSIAVYPLHEDMRGPLLAFNLLKIEKVR